MRYSGCIVSQVRRPSLELGGRRFESFHPDHKGNVMIIETISLPVKMKSGQWESCYLKSPRDDGALVVTNDGKEIDTYIDENEDYLEK